MSFKSKLKTVGKIAMKAAPIAAMFIPGVGPLASLGIRAATGALSGAADGGWKGALMGGGLGAATGGLGPSGGTMAKVMNAIPGGLNIASGALANRGGGAQNEYTGGSENQAMGRSASDVGNNTRRAPDNKSIGSTLGDREELRRYEGISSGKHPITPSLMGNPDLYTSLRAGSRMAVQDQGFRKGYETRTTDGGDPETITTSKMPKISASYARYANQQNPRRQAQGRNAQY